MQPAIQSNRLTPLADMQEPTLQRLEAQLPATRRALAWERRERCDGLRADEEER